MPRPGDHYGQIPNPFVQEPPRISEYTASQIATLQSRLDRYLGPEYIASRAGAGGAALQYIPGEKVIGLANEIFGFNGWSSSIQNVQIDYVDEVNGRFSVGLSIICRVTLKDGTYHEDVGYGTMKNAPDKGTAFQKCKKEAATDAVKRALRSFGNVLGNCLYDKDYAGVIKKIRPPPRRWDTDNFHRHPEYMPPKVEEEPAKETNPEILAQILNAPIQDVPVMHEDDEYGGNVFDDMDFVNPDEVRAGRELSPVKRVGQHHERRNSMPNNAGVGSVEQARRQPQTARLNATSQLNPNNQNNAAKQAPQPNIQPASNSVPQSRPVTNGQPIRAGPNQQADARQQVARPNAEQSATSIPPNPPRTPGPQQNGPQMGQQVGFSTSKSLLNAGNPETPIPANVPLKPFDPLKPLGVRTSSGVNHTRSLPVKRLAVAQPAVAVGNSVPQRVPNVVDPRADATRKIGMPGGMSPLANRGTYKPPGPAVKRNVDGQARTALSDVSNIQNVAPSGVDAKRQRIEGDGRADIPEPRPQNGVATENKAI